MARKKLSKQNNWTKADEPRRGLLASVIADAAKPHLLLAWGEGVAGYEIQYVELESEVRSHFLKDIRAAADDLAKGRAYVPYDPEWPLSTGEYFLLADDELPGEGLFDDIADFLQLPVFKKKSLKKPRLYIVAVQTPNGNAFFGKRMAYLKILGHQRGAFAAVWDGSTFSALVDSVATFADTFDWVYWGGKLYVTQGANFHAEFRDSDEIRAAVQAHVDAISAKIRIEGVDEFVKRCQASVQMASKLSHVAKHGIWAEPIRKLKRYAIERDLDVQWNGDALVFDGSIEHQWAILRLLAEDRTEGPVSGRTYESAAKREISLRAVGTGGRSKS
jgi:hypothetical protein